MAMLCLVLMAWNYSQVKFCLLRFDMLFSLSHAQVSIVLWPSFSLLSGCVCVYMCVCMCACMCVCMCAYLCLDFLCLSVCVSIYVRVNWRSRACVCVLCEYVCCEILNFSVLYSALLACSYDKAGDDSAKGQACYEAGNKCWDKCMPAPEKAKFQPDPTATAAQNKCAEKCWNADNAW